MPGVLAELYIPLQKVSMVMTKITAGENSKYGRHLPHLVLVRSTKVPIIGSLMASHTRATAIKILMAIAGIKITDWK